MEVLLVLGGGHLHPLHPLHSLVDGDHLHHHHRVAPDGDPDLLHQDGGHNWAVEDLVVVGPILVIVYHLHPYYKTHTYNIQT